MRIGIDFDNTIVCYDNVFYETANSLGWINGCKDVSKKGVKNYLIQRDLEPRWTELQGIVYGKAIANAPAFAGAKEVIGRLGEVADLYLVSHKTRYPIIGEKLDFHLAARSWLRKNGIYELFKEHYFCPEKKTKINTIKNLNLHYFVDDLPSILLDPEIPKRTQKILFGTEICEESSCKRAETWWQVEDLIR